MRHHRGARDCSMFLQLFSQAKQQHWDGHIYKQHPHFQRSLAIAFHGY